MLHFGVIKVLTFYQFESREVMMSISAQGRGLYMKYVHKIFQKTNISYPLIREVRVRIKGLEMLNFRKIFCTYNR